MAKYPVEISDSEGIVDAVNYLLSGPAGLGQNFAGFSASADGYLTGNNRLPYSKITPVNLYVAPIALSTSEMLDPRTWKFTFASTQASPPFQLGQPLTISGVADSWYDDTYNTIGVSECTVDYVITRTSKGYPNPGPSTGGTASVNVTNRRLSTDCNGRVTVTGGTDRVFINAQLDSTVSYITPTPSPLRYIVQVNRFRGEVNNDPTNPDFVFVEDGDNFTVAEKIYYTPTLDPSYNRVTGLTITSGTGHVPRTTYPTTYGVMPEVTSGSGSNLTLNIEIKPNVATSSTGLSSGGPYFGPGTAVPYRDAPWNFKTITAAVGTGTSCTVSLTNSAPAFAVGQSVRITGTSSPSFDGTYKITAATPTSLTFDSAVSGTATVDPSATASNPFFSTVITIDDPGQGFQIGDTVLIKGSQIGGADGTNDLVLTVSNVSVNTPIVLPAYDTVFTSIIDKPGPGYYWYILEVKFDTLGGEAVMTENKFGYRGLSAQVVKE